MHEILEQLEAKREWARLGHQTLPDSPEWRADFGPIITSFLRYSRTRLTDRATNGN